MQPLVTNLTILQERAEQLQNENIQFCKFVLQQNDIDIDTIVHDLNQTISAQIDCTQCGNCCKTLMINVSVDEVNALATYLNEQVPDVKEKYIETSSHGQMIMNTIPCHFLKDKCCNIYDNRFTECREFPHLHKKNFSKRLPGTMNYYAMCPIIFNVVEQLKSTLQFTMKDVKAYY